MPRVSGARGQNQSNIIQAVRELASFVAVVYVLGVTEVGQNLGGEGLARSTSVCRVTF